MKADASNSKRESAEGFATFLLGEWAVDAETDQPLVADGWGHAWIEFVGLPGAGKTTLGKRVASRLNSSILSGWAEQGGGKGRIVPFARWAANAILRPGTYFFVLTWLTCGNGRTRRRGMAVIREAVKAYSRSADGPSVYDQSILQALSAFYVGRCIPGRRVLQSILRALYCGAVPPWVIMITASTTEAHDALIQRAGSNLHNVTELDGMCRTEAIQHLAAQRENIERLIESLPAATNVLLAKRSSGAFLIEQMGDTEQMALVGKDLR